MESKESGPGFQRTAEDVKALGSDEGAPCVEGGAEESGVVEVGKRVFDMGELPLGELLCSGAVLLYVVAPKGEAAAE